MATANNIQLRSARNLLLNAVLAPPQPEFSLVLSTDNPNTFLRAKWQGPTSIPKLTIAQKTPLLGPLVDFSFSVPPAEPLFSISTLEEPIAVGQILKHWNDTPEVSLEAVQKKEGLVSAQTRISPAAANGQVNQAVGRTLIIDTDLLESYLEVLYSGQLNKQASVLVQVGETNQNLLVEISVTDSQLEVVMRQDQVPISAILQQWEKVLKAGLAGDFDLFIPGRISAIPEIPFQRESQLLPPSPLALFPINDLPICYFSAIELDTPGTILVLGAEGSITYKLQDLNSPDQTFAAATETLDLSTPSGFAAFLEAFTVTHPNSEWGVFTVGQADQTLVELSEALVPISEQELINQPKLEQLSQSFRERWRNVLKFTTPNITQDVRLAIVASTATGLSTSLQQMVNYQTNLNKDGELLVVDLNSGSIKMMVRGSQNQVEYQAFNDAKVGLVNPTSSTAPAPVVINANVPNSSITVRSAKAGQTITVSVVPDGSLSAEQPVDFTISDSEDGNTAALIIRIFGVTVSLDKIKKAWLKKEDRQAFLLAFQFDHLGLPVESTASGEVILQVPRNRVNIATGIGVRAFQRVDGNQPFKEVFLDARLADVGVIQNDVTFNHLQSDQVLFDIAVGDFDIDFPSTQQGVSYVVYTVDLPIDFSFKIQASAAYQPDGQVSNAFITARQASPAAHHAVFGGRPDAEINIPFSVKRDQLIMVRALTIAGEQWINKHIVVRPRPDPALVLEPEVAVNKVRIIEAEAKVGYLVVRDTMPDTITPGNNLFLPAANNFIGWEAHGQRFGMQIAAAVPTEDASDSLFRIDGTPALGDPLATSGSISLTLPSPGASTAVYKIFALREFNGLHVVLQQKIEQAADGTLTILEAP